MSTAGSYTGVEQVAAVRPVRNVSDDDEGEMRCWARTRSRIRPMGARPRMRGLRRHPCRAPEGRLPKRDRLGCTTATASPPPKSPVRRPPLNVCTGQQVRVGAGHSPFGPDEPGEAIGIMERRGTGRVGQFGRGGVHRSRRGWLKEMGLHVMLTLVLLRIHVHEHIDLNPEEAEQSLDFLVVVLRNMIARLLELDGYVAGVRHVFFRVGQVLTQGGNQTSESLAFGFADSGTAVSTTPRPLKQEGACPRNSVASMVDRHGQVKINSVTLV
jgi:hypothetical protein